MLFPGSICKLLLAHLPISYIPICCKHTQNCYTNWQSPTAISTRSNYTNCVHWETINRCRLTFYQLPALWFSKQHIFTVLPFPGDPRRGMANRFAHNSGILSFLYGNICRRLFVNNVRRDCKWKKNKFWCKNKRQGGDSSFKTRCLRSLIVTSEEPIGWGSDEKRARFSFQIQEQEQLTGFL